MNFARRVNNCDTNSPNEELVGKEDIQCLNYCILQKINVETTLKVSTTSLSALGTKIQN